MRAAERKGPIQDSSLDVPEAGDSSAATPLRATEEIEAFAGDPNFMTSLARGLAVMRGFSQEQRRLSIAQLSRKTGIPRAAVPTCRRGGVQLPAVLRRDRDLARDQTG